TEAANAREAAGSAEAAQAAAESVQAKAVKAAEAVKAEGIRRRGERESRHRGQRCRKQQFAQHLTTPSLPRRAAPYCGVAFRTRSPSALAASRRGAASSVLLGRFASIKRILERADVVRQREEPVSWRNGLRFGSHRSIVPRRLLDIGRQTG